MSRFGHSDFLFSNLYADLFQGAASCCALSRFHQDLPLRGIPAIWHLEGTHAGPIKQEPMLRRQQADGASAVGNVVRIYHFC